MAGGKEAVLKFPLSQQQEEDAENLIKGLERDCARIAWEKLDPPNDGIESSIAGSSRGKAVHTAPRNFLTDLADPYQGSTVSPTTLADSEGISAPTGGYHSRTQQPRQPVHGNTGTSKGKEAAHDSGAKSLPLSPEELEEIAAVDALVDRAPDLPDSGYSHGWTTAKDCTAAGTSRKPDEDARAKGGVLETKVQRNESSNDRTYQFGLVETAPQLHDQSAPPHNPSLQLYDPLLQPQDPSAQLHNPWLQPQAPHVQSHDPGRQPQDQHARSHNLWSQSQDQYARQHVPWPQSQDAHTLPRDQTEAQDQHAQVDNPWSQPQDQYAQQHDPWLQPQDPHTLPRTQTQPQGQHVQVDNPWLQPQDQYAQQRDSGPQSHDPDAPPLHHPQPQRPPFRAHHLCPQQ
ncbi:MAG: hypothetical protein Q9165_000403 [Trypethelium subeluteriae]